MGVFFDLDLIFSLFTIHGLLISKIHRSASAPLLRVPLFISNIFAGLHVNAAISLFNLIDLLWKSSRAKGNNVSTPEAPVAA